jgi:GT2 family glycosyltransferase
MNSAEVCYPIFSRYAEAGLIQVRHCSFVSVLVAREAISDVGLPIPQMFIYGDDIEFTERISKNFDCYYVLYSRVVHATKTNEGADIGRTSPDQLWKYYYDVRNRIFRYRAQGASVLLRYCLSEWPRSLARAMLRREGRGKAVSASLRGMVAGWFFHPKITRVN